jgi:hypothetical protein
MQVDSFSTISTFDYDHQEYSPEDEEMWSTLQLLASSITHPHNPHLKDSPAL